MPISRKKACHCCRIAKAKCNLAAPPCSRCTERGSRCEYDRPRLGPYTRHVEVEESAATPVAQLINPDVPTSCEISASSDAWPAMWDELNFGGQFSASLLTPATPFSPTGFHQREAQLMNVDTELFAPSQNTKLLKRAPESAHEFFTLKVMLGQLESYPKMMIEGLVLPPFVHSKCALDDTGSFECRERHTCLSEHLSICASLVHLFYTRTPTNSEFVWKTIYNEQERIHKEYLTYDNETLLEAIQAICIYVILQAEDQESQMKNDPHSLIQTMGDLGSKVHTSSGYEDYQGNPANRRVWILQESTRRTICLLYIIETLLNVIIGERDAVKCQGFGRMPLSCPRSLWEVKSTSEWAKRYREMLAKRKSSRAVTISDLKRSMKLPTSQLCDHKDDEGVLSDIMTWCEGLDQFGTLIWMASTVSKGIA